MGCSCKVLFFNAPIFMVSNSLRQSTSTARIGMCFPSSDSSREGSGGLEIRSREASAWHSKKTLVTGHDPGTEEAHDFDAEIPFFQSLHDMLRDDEESSSASEEQPLYSEWPQISNNGKSRIFASQSRGGGYTFCAEDEELTRTFERDKDKDSMIGNDTNADGEAEDDSFSCSLGSREKKKARVKGLLLEGNSPIEVLNSLPGWGPAEFWMVVSHLAIEKRFGEALQVFAWWRGQENYSPREKHYVTFIRMLGLARRPDISELIFNQMKAFSLQPGLASYTALMDSYAEASCFDRAEALARKFPEYGIKPNAATFNRLMLAYMKQGKLDNMNKLLNNMKRWGCPPDYRTYRCMIVAYAKAGLFRRMERLWKEMDNNDWKLDSFIINAIIQGYAAHGLVNEMHASYLRMKDYRVLVTKATIRATASVYIRTSKFYQLRLFVKDVGLLRKDFGNLLWNLLLLAFAANFQVKNMQRSCLGMEMGGFAYDLTTYNICALCYARMKMLWELHALLVRMRRAGLEPDLVTFGAVVDAYIFGQERFQKMFMELDELGLKDRCPDVSTDPLVFQAFGKGDFQSSTETLMRINPEPYGKSWTYGLLLSFYLKRRGARRIDRNACERQGSRFVAKKFYFSKEKMKDPRFENGQ